MTSPAGMMAALVLDTYPLDPTSRRARTSDASSRRRVPSLVLTNRGVRAAFSPAITALARFSCMVSVLLSRAARLAEYAQIARHDPGCAAGSQAGSARTLASFSLLRPLLGGWCF